jgi:Spy/CpxP family protein refolding chaperone
MSWKQYAAICLVLAVAAPASAQQGGNRRHTGPMPVQLLKLKTTLELTDDQVAQLEALQDDFAEQRSVRQAQARDLREQAQSGDVTPNDLREQVAAHRESGREIAASHAQMVQQVLTDEQRGKLDEIREAGRQRGPGQRGMRGRRGPGNRQGLRSGRGGHRGTRPGLRRGRNRGGPPLREGRRGGGRG